MSRLSYPNRQQILVVGFPRSGNTVCSRMLGDLLNAPVTGAYNAKPLAEEGLGRTGSHVVRQLHLKPLPCPNYTGPALRSGWCFCTTLWTTECIVHIVRDPRDVAVSAQHYWQAPALRPVVEAMCEGGRPFGAVGIWQRFVNAWLNTEIHNTSEEFRIFTIRFEDLITEPHITLSNIVKLFNLHPINDLNAVIKRNTFQATRERVTRDGNTRPYGRAIQLHHLRKGIAGDWVNHWTPDLLAYAKPYWLDLCDYLGYDWD